MNTGELSAVLRRGALHVSDASARVTSPARMLPGFLVVGAQRCGTTSMFKALAQQPLVAKPFLRKGVHFFDIHYDQGVDWYRGNFPLVPTSRLRRFGAGRPLTGESSPYYMFHPLAAERIARDLPDVKLLVMLRDPVERAYSAHAHEFARGHETEPFEQAVALEPERVAGKRERMLAEPGYQSYDLQHHAYLARGQYHEQLSALEALVGRHRLLPVDSQQFFDDPGPVFSEVLSFLDLPDGAGTVFERHNSRSRSPMPDALRASLDEHFASHDARLAAWWGRTPSWRSTT